MPRIEWGCSLIITEYSTQFLTLSRDTATTVVECGMYQGEYVQKHCRPKVKLHVDLLAFFESSWGWATGFLCFLHSRSSEENVLVKQPFFAVINW